MSDLLSPWFGATSVALVPAVWVMWRGRIIRRYLDDPALPERRMRASRQNLFVAVTSLAVLGALWYAQLWWAGPLLVLALLCAGFPLRKLLHGETWSLAAYLSFLSRLMFSYFGFWLLLGATPWLVKSSGVRGWIAAGVLAGILLIWNARFSDVVRRVMRTHPVDDPALVARFSQLVAAAGLSPPRFERLDLRGGVVANAVALPSLRRSTVLISETLLTRLDPDEIIAVCAHELAHLEHYNARRLRRLNLFVCALIAAGALLVPVARAVTSAELSLLPVLWVLVLLLAIGRLAHDRQKQETASDLRAIALTGDPEALIRALTKLHAIARIARRWSAQVERSASHPSLARRIQAIRNAAGGPIVSLAEPASFAGADGLSFVTFHDDRLIWEERPGITHTLSYGSLTELRVEATRSRARLIAVADAAGRRWELGLDAGAIARVQGVLDVVDARLAAPAARPSESPAMARVLASLSVLVALGVDQFSLSLVLLLSCVTPISPVGFGAGLATLAGAALAWRDHGWPAGDDLQPWLALMLIVCGAGLLVLARRERGKTTPVMAKLVAMLAILSALAWTLVAANGLNAISLHQAVRTWPAVVVFPAAVAGALARHRSTGGRAASISVGIASVIAIFVGSTTFLDAFGRDPLLQHAEPPVMRTLAGAPVAEMSVEFGVSRILASPGGRSVAIASESDDERQTFHIGRLAGPLTPFEADDAIFIDDDRLIIASGDRDGTTVRQLDVGRAKIIWEQHVAGLLYPRLAVDSRATQWRIHGWNSRHQEILRAEGRVDGGPIQEERWQVPADSALGELIEVMGSADQDVFIVDTHYRLSLADRAVAPQWTRLVDPTIRRESGFTVLKSGGPARLAVSRLEVACRDSSMIESPAACTVFDGTRTRVFSVDSVPPYFTALVSLKGRFFATDYAGGWLAGWWQNKSVAMRLSMRELFTTGSETEPVQFSATTRGLAAFSFAADRSTIRFYAQ